MNDKRISEMDSFWAIDKLLPKKEKPRVVRPVPDTSAVEITIGQLTENNGSKLTQKPSDTQAPTVKRTEPTPETVYSPVSLLIDKVKIYRWKNNYNYYEDFRKDALRFYKSTAQECKRVPYFSYVPQYVQLSREQLSWYLFWRDRVRHGEFLPTDYSYIILLIFEIINLGESADTVQGQKLLCELQKHYRREYPRIDRYLSEWICDYSLIHKLPPPEGFCESGLADSSSLREFYVYFEGTNAPDSYAHLLIRFCSNYDYRKSKFAVGENLALYEKHIPAALALVISKNSDPDKIFSGVKFENNMLTRDAYMGALCAAEMKRRIEIEFCSFSRSHELRFLIADIIKYSENKIRASLGVKSRLSVFGLPKSITAVIDTYFSTELPTIKLSKNAEPTLKQEYDKLYDIPKTELSLENADLIEERSWSTTQLLVEAFDEEEIVVPEIWVESEASAEISDNPVDELKKQLGEKYEFIVAAKNEDFSAQHELAKKFSTFTGVLADGINDLAANILGDIILEETEDGYTIITDYMEMFEND